MGKLSILGAYSREVKFFSKWSVAFIINFCRILRSFNGVLHNIIFCCIIVLLVIAILKKLLP
jgi:hypothetical protein